ncbi:MAG: Adenylate kinase [Microgenomates group bacterium GW2011_GWB1_40_9]|nr:MAG: Adenylate kinase [Microgenomates group bacterium GW2011_GWC1_39_12]KKR78493.1 MAG: Adenylate kinase [Microgenomates group bacterium GW2011_GWB1_40_9]
MKIILLGPPASGKGTQGELLENKYHIQRLSVGALIRKHVHEQTSQGKRIEATMTAGKAIPADTYIELVGEWMLEHKDGFIIDNLIRSIDQLNAFDAFSKKNSLQLDFVFVFRVFECEARRRLHIRKAVKNRTDEHDEAIHARFVTFNTSISEIVEYFSKQHSVYEIDTSGTVDAIHQEIVSIIESRKPL